MLVVDHGLSIKDAWQTTMREFLSINRYKRGEHVNAAPSKIDHDWLAGFKTHLKEKYGRVLK